MFISRTSAKIAEDGSIRNGQADTRSKIPQQISRNSWIQEPVAVPEIFRNWLCSAMSGLLMDRRFSRTCPVESWILDAAVFGILQLLRLCSVVFGRLLYPRFHLNPTTATIAAFTQARMSPKTCQEISREDKSETMVKSDYYVKCEENRAQQDTEIENTEVFMLYLA